MYISWWCSVPSVRPLNVWEKSSIQSSVGNAEDNNTIYGQPPSRAATFLLFAGRLPRGWVRRMAMIDKGPGKRQGDQANRGLAAQTPSRGSVFGLADGMFRRWLLQWYMLWHRIIDFIAEIARYGDLCNRDGCMPRRSLSGEGDSDISLSRSPCRAHTQFTSAIREALGHCQMSIVWETYRRNPPQP